MLGYTWKQGWRIGDERLVCDCYCKACPPNYGGDLQIFLDDFPDNVAELFELKISGNRVLHTVMCIDGKIVDWNYVGGKWNDTDEQERRSLCQ